MSDGSPIFFGTGKSWQNPHYQVIWQILRHSDRRPIQAPKKFFLILNGTQTDFGITLSDIKPDNLHADAAFTNLARKYIRQALITGIFKDRENGDIWLRMRASGEEDSNWFVLAQCSKPPSLQIIHRCGDIYISWGMEGTFTKKRQRAESIPEFNPPRFTEISVSLMDALVGATTSLDEAEVLSPTDSVAIDQDQKDLIHRLKRRLKTLRKTYDRQKELIPSTDDLHATELQAQMLQSYGYLVKEGDDHLELNPMQTGLETTLTIELNPDRSLGHNIDALFTRIKKQKKSVQLGTKQLENIRRDMDETSADIARLTSTPLTATERSSYFAKHKLPNLGAVPIRQASAPTASPYRTYRSSSGQRILVGKGASENDELTRMAKANDYWVHAVGVTGSHVIIPATRENRDVLDPTTLREAALLALHFSKFKQDLAGEVYVTRKSHLKKKKDMPPGLWLIGRSETLFFRYNQNEVDDLLKRGEAGI